MASGDYGNLVLTSYLKYAITFSSTVTIVSADPDNPAVFSGLTVADGSNITFDGITFDYTFEAGDPIWQSPFRVAGSENIVIRNATFNGDLAHDVSATDDGYGYGIGLAIRDSVGVTVENSEFFEFHRGLTVTGSRDVTVRGNDLHDLRMDGMNFTAITGALIEENYIHDFRGSVNSGDHSDMIQFWTSGTDVPSTDITIRGNTLDVGTGTFTQSIFMRNEQVDRGLAGTEMFYRNILIEENVIVNGHLHGIAVGEADGLVIRGNSVLHADGTNATGTSVDVPQISVALTSTAVTIANNATSAIVGWSSQADWTVVENAIVQDKDASAPGFYGDVFIASTLQSTDGVHNFQSVTGGMLDILGAGAARTREPAGEAGLTVEFHMAKDDSNSALHHFDAAYAMLNREELPEGTTFQWDFGDGTTGTGDQIDHTYTDGGTYDVTLTVVLPDGRTDAETVSLGVAGPNVLAYDATQGFVAYENGKPFSLASDEGSASLEAGSGGEQAATSDAPAGLKLGGDGITASVGREHVTEILGEDEFSISMTLTADSADSWGEVVRLHSSFIVSIDAYGELIMSATTTEGLQIRARTDGANLSDQATHDIDISLVDGILSIAVDGEIMADADMSAPLRSYGNHNLTFGNPWDGHFFAGTLSAFAINVNAGDFAEITSTTTQDSKMFAADEIIFIPPGPAMSEQAEIAPDTEMQVSLAPARYIDVIVDDHTDVWAELLQTAVLDTDILPY
ncbi:right-handed parallel beta-helix repeat-containing protein [Puniceibacterium sp. IMCC21224]|uniref:right-handed parallel beta-helix repeat-containing protein n=1 Tax=Puniceibacterium sp. IMCC21224 TaxID=1618204 RepID=UPI00064DF6CA|nr:right-handed parallel beta-helix repeat-containing protein [Puniceibacterium sp. IMCC21224]